MKQRWLIAAAVIASGALCAVAGADSAPVKSLSETPWGAAPPVLSKGAQMAVIAGDPSKSGLVILRLKVPAGYVISPHFHPTDEFVTVLKGTLSLGMGDTVDKAKATKLLPGGYAVAPAQMHHYAFSADGATFQVTLEGPFAITYVNAADDPSKSQK